MPHERAPRHLVRSRLTSVIAIGLALLLTGGAVEPVAGSQAAIEPGGVAQADPPAATDLAVALSQSATTYDATTNRARVQVTVTPTGPELPWSWSVAVRGTTVASGSSSDAQIATTVTNDCSITTMSVTTTVTDNLGRTTSAASTLDRALCPPPPAYPHARDRIIAGPTLTEASFVDRLRAMSSPALGEGRAIYRTLLGGGVNPAFALAMFHAESQSGTRGYAVITKNWGNILFYDWEIAYGATPYKPGNGYTYAKYPTWLASIRAYVALVQRYQGWGYLTVSSASAHWLGTIEGSSRHLIYLNNIVNVMTILPDDAVPVMTRLYVPSAGGAAFGISFAGRDNLAVTGYQVRQRRGTTGTWSVPILVSSRGTTMRVSTGTWTIAVRATDAAGNWSRWWSKVVRVDAGIPVMTGFRAPRIVRSTDGHFTTSWAGTDNIGVTRYQWRVRKGATGVPSAPRGTTHRGITSTLGAGTWYMDVRARDAVGNASPWRTVRIVVPRDDRAFAFSAGTRRRTALTAYHGTLTTTTARGARLTMTCSQCVGLVLVGRAGPRYGKLQVTIDGTSKVIDTGYFAGRRPSSNHDRVVLFSTGLAPGSHTVTIVNLATAGRPTIALDGLGFIV